MYGLSRTRAFSQENHLDADALVDAAESLKDHHAGVLNEILKAGYKEEVVNENSFTLSQFLLCPIEVKVNIKCFDEGGDWVFVGVGLLLDNFNEVLHYIAPGALVDDNSSREIAKDPWAGCLDGVEVLLLVQKQFNNQVSAFRVVEEYIEGPMDEPSTLLECLQSRAEG